MVANKQMTEQNSELNLGYLRRVVCTLSVEELLLFIFGIFIVVFIDHLIKQKVLKKEIEKQKSQ